MREIALRAGADLEGFRRAARALAAEAVPPQEVSWRSGDDPGLFGAADEPSQAPPPLALPRDVAKWIGAIVCHSSPERYALLYQLVWRVTHGERALLEVASDPLVHGLLLMMKAVRRDIHKMHAFLRFRRVEGAGPERFVAWFEPDHHILQAAAPFFVERFRGMAWSILTPSGSVHWDRKTLTEGPAGRREDAPGEDSFEAGWQTYYESTFNPARTNPDLMRQHMPKKYWHNMPETAAIPRLIQNAAARVDGMLEQEPTIAARRVPAAAIAAMSDQGPKNLAELNAIIRASEPLVPGATQAVVGEGPVHAGMVFVGEQPGDEEDIQGRPFVGPAGRLLDRALQEAGIERKAVYLTNAVKHFKFEQRGKRRIHAKPSAGEVSHYRWWLMKELDLIEPRLVVALGATAVLALTGKQVPITRARGPSEFLERRPGYITVHPSYLLRLPDAAAKAAAYADFVRDLTAAGQLVAA